jgi:hypothetical protein
LKEFMANKISEEKLLETLYMIHYTYKKGDKYIWYRWHEGHPLAITVGDIKSSLTQTRNRGYLYECIEATINDNSLVVNFS